MSWAFFYLFKIRKVGKKWSVRIASFRAVILGRGFPGWMPTAAPWSSVQYKRHVRIFLPKFVSPIAGSRIKAHQDSARLFVHWISSPVNFIYTRFSMTDNIGSCKQRREKQMQHFCTDGAAARRIYRLPFWKSLHRGFSNISWDWLYGDIQLYLAITILNISHFRYAPFRRGRIAQSV
jgi:hypothetical protein